MRFDVLRPSRRWMAAAVAALAIVVYVNAVPNGFALDDESIVQHNERVHGIDRIADAVSLPYWPRSPARLALWRPLTTATFAVEWDLWNGDPRGFHAVNVALHGAVTVLVFLLVAAMGAPPAAAALGAAVFAVHPVHTEAVANVVGRAELLAALFYLAGCLLYLADARRTVLRAIGVGTCYFLALASKEIAVTMPAALLLLEAGRSTDDRGLALRLRRHAPVVMAIVLAAVVYGLARIAVLGSPIGVDTAASLMDATTGQRLATAVSVWPEYVRLLILPYELIADYSPGVLMRADGLTWRVGLGALLGIGTLVLAFVFWHRSRLFSLSVFWVAVAIFPVSNLVVRVGVLVAERTLYLPSVAVAFATALLAARVAIGDARRRRLAAAAMVVVLAAGAWRTWTRNPVWRDTQAVIASLARDHPESFRVQWIIADNRLREGRITEGLDLYDRVAELMPNHYRVQADYGSALVTHGRPVRGEAVLRRAVALMPEHAEPIVLLSQSLINQGRPDDALRAVVEAQDRMPARGALYHQMATALAQLGEWEAALLARQVSLNLAGAGADWRQWRSLALIQYRLGDVDGARRAIHRGRPKAPAGARDELTLDRIAERARSLP